MTPPPARRDLTFADFDDVIGDANALLRTGSTRVGRWDLAQTCGHLAEWLHYPVDGFPPMPAPARLLMALLRNTVGPRLLRKTLSTQALPSRSPTIPQSVPAEGGDARAAVDRLAEAIERFRRHEGPYRPSPLFGAMDRATTTRLQLIHCAHHLGHLIPNQG